MSNNRKRRRPNRRAGDFTPELGAVTGTDLDKPFLFTEGGRVYKLPPAKVDTSRVTGGDIMDAALGKADEQLGAKMMASTILASGLDDETMAALRRLRGDEFQRVVERWMRASQGVGTGGIFQLLELIARWPEELTYDWLTRIGRPISALTTGEIGWLEAYLFTRALLRDPTTRIHAAAAGWEHPWSHEARILADVYDLTQAAHTDKRRRGRAKPYPRPWSKTKRRSAKPTVPQEQIRAALAARGH